MGRNGELRHGLSRTGRGGENTDIIRKARFGFVPMDPWLTREKNEHLWVLQNGDFPNPVHRGR